MNNATPSQHQWLLCSFNNWWGAFVQFNFNIYFWLFNWHPWILLSKYICIHCFCSSSCIPKFIFEMSCEFLAICIIFPNRPLTSLSCKSIFTVNITLAFTLVSRIPACPPVSLSFQFNTLLIFCIETFLGSYQLLLYNIFQHCLIVWVCICIFCINMEHIFTIVFIFRK